VQGAYGPALMWRGEATINNPRSGAGRRATDDANARVQRTASGVEAWPRLLAIRAPRWGSGSGAARCHAGGELRPLLLMTLRQQAVRADRRVLPRMSLGTLAAGLGSLAVILMALLTSVAPSRSDAPVTVRAVAEVVPTAEDHVATATAAVGDASTPPARAAAPPEGDVRVVALRIVEPQPIPVTVGELYQALARSPWPRELWPQVVRIAQCESRWGSGLDSAAEGDGGRALGVLQIRVDAHRELARDFNLLTIDGALGAAWVVYQRSGRSFEPWSCA
jgi:hypothetical protein